MPYLPEKNSIHISHEILYSHVWVFNLKKLISCTSELHNQKFFVRVFHGNIHLRGASTKVKITDIYHSVVLTFRVEVCHLLSKHVRKVLQYDRKAWFWKQGDLPYPF